MGHVRPRGGNWASWEITTITSASAAALQTRVKPHLWGRTLPSPHICVPPHYFTTTPSLPIRPLSFWPGLRVAPRVTKLLFVGFADGHHVRGGGVSGRQELAATHEDLRDLHNGEPRSVSRFVAFFRPTILVTRRRDHFVAAHWRSGSPSATSRPASPQRGRRCSDSRFGLVQIWMWPKCNVVLWKYKKKYFVYSELKNWIVWEKKIIQKKNVKIFFSFKIKSLRYMFQ